jgi:hypothetical protein
MTLPGPLFRRAGGLDPSLAEVIRMRRAGWRWVWWTAQFIPTVTFGHVSLMYVASPQAGGWVAVANSDLFGTRHYRTPQLICPTVALTMARVDDWGGV